MVTNEQIQEVTKIIVDTVHPQKIYLFGSYANGKATEESDLDLLIIMPDRSLKKYEVANLIENKISRLIDIDKDLIIDYSDRYKMFSTISYSFLGHIVSTGKLLYDN